MSARCKSRAARNPEKKALSQQADKKKALAKERACAIFRADSHRATALAPRIAIIKFEE
jgi:hypothetical protein